MNTYQTLFFVACLAASVECQWDPTTRDKTDLCAQLAQYTPTAEIYCQQFVLCCNSQFDPNNGDKCQMKEVDCEPMPNTNTGRGTCVFSNCTELVTTTTTTTANPRRGVNDGPSLLGLPSSLAATATFCLLFRP